MQNLGFCARPRSRPVHRIRSEGYYAPRDGLQGAASRLAQTPFRVLAPARDRDSERSNYWCTDRHRSDAEYQDEHRHQLLADLLSGSTAVPCPPAGHQFSQAFAGSQEVPVNTRQELTRSRTKGDQYRHEAQKVGLATASLVWESGPRSRIWLMTGPHPVIFSGWRRDIGRPPGISPAVGVLLGDAER
jgi:hypothetical protein